MCSTRVCGTALCTRLEDGWGVGLAGETHASAGSSVAPEQAGVTEKEDSGGQGLVRG